MNRSNMTKDRSNESDHLGSSLTPAGEDAGCTPGPWVSGEQTPIVRNPDAPGDLAVGEYVFASRWGDCDWCDPWCVGHVSALDHAGYVTLAESPRRWRHAMRITPEQGRRIVEQYPELERQFVSLDYERVASIFGVNAMRDPVKDQG